MGKIKDLLILMRPYQWYKNLLLFIPIFFGKLVDVNGFTLSFLGFISLCCISSAGYIISDLFDIREDKSHPEKKNRPLASGKTGTRSAYLLIFVLSIISVFIAGKIRDQL